MSGKISDPFLHYGYHSILLHSSTPPYHTHQLSTLNGTQLEFFLCIFVVCICVCVCVLCHVMDVWIYYRINKVSTSIYLLIYKSTFPNVLTYFTSLQSQYLILKPTFPVWLFTYSSQRKRLIEGRKRLTGRVTALPTRSYPVCQEDRRVFHFLLWWEFKQIILLVSFLVADLRWQCIVIIFLYPSVTQELYLYRYCVPPLWYDDWVSAQSSFWQTDVPFIDHKLKF